MNNFPYIHSDNSIKKINYSYIIALLFPILFGFYKNGIYLYKKELISFYKIFYPILYPILGFGICIIVEFILKKIKKEKYQFNSLYPIQGMIVGCLIFPRVNILIYITSMFIISFIILFLKIGNKTAIMSMFLIVIFKILGYDMLNNYESVNSVIKSTGLMFIGHTPGGISSTSVLFLIISYIYLSTKMYYKKEAVFYYVITLFILSILLFINNHHLYNSFLLMFSYNTFFCGVFILTDIKSCPNNLRKVYGVVAAIISFILIFYFKVSFGSLIAITLLSFLSPFFEKIEKKTQKSLKKCVFFNKKKGNSTLISYIY